MGNVDKIVRLLVAIVIAALAYMEVISGTLAVVLLVLAGIFLLTSVVGFCPLYWPFKISTCKSKKFTGPNE